MQGAGGRPLPRVHGAGALGAGAGARRGGPPGMPCGPLPGNTSLSCISTPSMTPCIITSVNTVSVQTVKQR